MTATIAGSVDLLGRALDYTCDRLGGVDDGLLGRPTPCSAWPLGALLGHMEDSLDAFTEAAGGQVQLCGPPAVGAAGRIGAIREKARGLLQVWQGVGPGDVRVGGLDLASPLLVATAALEVTVHGWDVGQGTGDRVPVPRALAVELLPVAHSVIVPADRIRRFADPVPTAPGAPEDVRLLAFVGRG